MTDLEGDRGYYLTQMIRGGGWKNGLSLEANPSDRD